MATTIHRSEPSPPVRRLVIGLAITLVLLIGMWYPLLLVSAASKPPQSSQPSLDSAAQSCTRQDLGAVQVDWTPGRLQAICPAAVPHAGPAVRR
jgi:hypothetical protein